MLRRMEAIADRLRPLAERYGVRDIYVFGSRAGAIVGRAPAPVRSDLDVAVQPLPARSLSARNRVRLTGALEELFEVPRVDLVVLAEASPFLAVEVVSGELLYTSDPRAQAEHELYILRRAADLAPFQRERTRQILSAGAR